MKALRAWGMVVAFVAVVAGVLWLVWNFNLRWKPHAITQHQAEISKAVETAGWVSPHLTGPKLYVICPRNDSACLRFQTQEFAKLQAGGIDTRFIAIAPPDANGQPRSTPAERATVAELWLNRGWKLYQQWNAAPPAAWTAAGLPPADGDVARTAVVELGRKLMADLTPMLDDNGIKATYPILIWWTKDGQMHGCACDRLETYRAMETELGV